ncbi:histidine phosphatase family protein [Thioalkalivibrio sp. ALM2T]|uniref:histidine phosphatase family protein n=1 Tax=Thioalkalivibrio sp. ALM2T TaxID=1158184 RepID=UPI001E554A86|nr:histidine phosphatase family protein [Thioalkalivibrio sp. ALM2T]
MSFAQIAMHRSRGLLAGALVATAAFGVSSAAVADEALWGALEEGGKVVLLRHTESEEAEAEKSMHLATDGDCSAEVQLTGEGRAQAEALGKVLKERGIEVSAVVSSEFCRARQTADGAFGEYERWDALNLIAAMPEGESEWLIEDVRDRMSEHSGEGNLFLVTHRPNINTMVFENVDAGSLVVMRPEGMGSVEVLGVIPVEDYYGSDR